MFHLKSTYPELILVRSFFIREQTNLEFFWFRVFAVNAHLPINNKIENK